jgi:hypothetical protein
MFEMDPEVDGHIQQRLRLAVFLVTKIAMLVFDRLIARQKSHTDSVRGLDGSGSNVIVRLRIVIFHANLNSRE